MGERRIGSITAIKARAPVLGGNFGVWGGLFSTFDCTVKGIRKKEDPYNAIIAGFFTGGSLAIRGGYKAARNGAIGCAVLLAVIEGVGIGFQRMLAGGTKLEVSAYGRRYAFLFLAELTTFGNSRYPSLPRSSNWHSQHVPCASFDLYYDHDVSTHVHHTPLYQSFPGGFFTSSVARQYGAPTCTRSIPPLRTKPVGHDDLAGLMTYGVAEERAEHLAKDSQPRRI